MALWIQISAGSNEPLYAQLVNQISKAIAEGKLRPGDKLPAVRKLASELVINPNTVAKAYTYLEQAKLIVTKTGSGTYIADKNERSTDIAEVNYLNERIDNIITRAINLGLKPKDISEMYKSRLEKFSDKPGKSGEENE
ncbi:MAG: GntR family transcriptional regulator [Sedimentisphaerales bacterium]|nr:GntR family transcriptional regulator [Sedimentisphaerales bacterium]